MNKQSVVDSLKSQLKDQHDRAIAAAENAAEGATGDDTKAESKYDTRGLESSYLAAGQANQAEELMRVLTILDQFEFPDFTKGQPIEMGALVKTEFEGDADWYLLAPGGGGLQCESAEGETVTVLGPQAPLAARLLRKTAGEPLEESPLTIIDVL